MTAGFAVVSMDEWPADAGFVDLVTLARRDRGRHNLDVSSGI